MKGRFLSNLAWTLGTCGLLWVAAAGIASAAPVPELDVGIAPSGIALVLGAGLLLADRYRRRG